VVRRNSARDASLGLFQFNRESADYLSVKINVESAYTCKPKYPSLVSICLPGKVLAVM